MFGHDIYLTGRLDTFSTFSAFKIHNSVSLWVKITRKPSSIGCPSLCLERKQIPTQPPSVCTTEQPTWETAINDVVNWQMSKQDIRWPIPHDRIVGSGVDSSRLRVKILHWKWRTCQCPRIGALSLWRRLCKDRPCFKKTSIFLYFFISRQEPIMRVLSRWWPGGTLTYTMCKRHQGSTWQTESVSQRVGCRQLNE